MNKDMSFNIIDFGMSSVRFSIFDINLNEKFSETNVVFYDDEFKNHFEIIDSVIKKAEKKTSTHIKDIILILDSVRLTTIDISLNKNLDRKSQVKKVYDNLILELNQIIISNYSTFNILHIITTKCKVDNETFLEIPEGQFAEKNIKIEFKVICFPKKLIEKIKKNFINKNLKLENLFCASYIKTLNYLKKIDFKNVAFFEIGWERTSLISYQNNELKIIETIPIGSNHITKDISKIFNLTIEDAERIKKLFNESETEFSYKSVYENIPQSLKNNINKNISLDKLKQVILYRIQEIIDLTYKKLSSEINKQNLSKSHIFLIGGGSLIFKNNSFYLNDKFNFKSLNYYPESDMQICSCALIYHLNNAITPKKISKKTGLFERFFNFFSK